VRWVADEIVLDVPGEYAQDVQADMHVEFAAATQLPQAPVLVRPDKKCLGLSSAGNG
jgi:hypothetical protein